MRQPEKPFAQLYHEALRDKSISAEARFVAILIGTYVNQHSRLAWPRTLRLMELTGWGRDVVKRARAEAVRAGYLVEVLDHDRRGRLVNRWKVSEKLLREEARKP